MTIEAIKVALDRLHEYSIVHPNHDTDVLVMRAQASLHNLIAEQKEHEDAITFSKPELCLILSLFDEALENNSNMDVEIPMEVYESAIEKITEKFPNLSTYEDT